MGGVKDALFGKSAKSKSSSESGNYAYDSLKGPLGAATGYIGQAGGLASNMLNQGPGGFADTGGFKFLLDQGTNAVNSNFYSRGLGESGAAMKGLEKYRHGLASTYLTQYMDQVFKLGNLGLGSAGVLADAGRWSKSKGTQDGGKSGLAGPILGAIAASDMRLKTNLEFAGRDDNGVGYYYFDYDQSKGVKLPEGRHYGVLAQELKTVDPSAVVEMKNGYLGVKAPYLPRRID